MTPTNILAILYGVFTFGMIFSHMNKPYDFHRSTTYLAVFMVVSMLVIFLVSFR